MRIIVGAVVRVKGDARTNLLQFSRRHLAKAVSDPLPVDSRVCGNDGVACCAPHTYQTETVSISGIQRTREGSCTLVKISPA